MAFSPTTFAGDGDLDARGRRQVAAAADGGALRDPPRQDPRPPGSAIYVYSAKLSISQRHLSLGPERGDEGEAAVRRRGSEPVRRSRTRTGVGAEGHTGKDINPDHSSYRSYRYNSL